MTAFDVYRLTLPLAPYRTVLFPRKTEKSQLQFDVVLGGRGGTMMIIVILFI